MVGTGRGLIIFHHDHDALTPIQHSRYHNLRPTTARLAQSAERKALNLVVVGSSPTVGAFSGYPDKTLGCGFARAKCSMPRKMLHAAQSTPCRAKYSMPRKVPQSAPCGAKCSMPRKVLHAAQIAPCRAKYSMPRKVLHAAKYPMPQSAPCRKVRHASRQPSKTVLSGAVSR